MAKHESSLLADVLGSSTAGVIARFICHPIDTVKSRKQSGFRHFATGQTTASVLRDIFKLEGVSGLYRGFGAVVVGGTPGVCSYLTSYELLKRLACKHFPSADNKNFIYFSSGIGAEAISCIFFVPVDVIKERLQVTQSIGNFNPYRGSFHALKTIFKEEGLRGMYKGYAATVLSYGPFSALYFLFYERMKELWMAKQLQPLADISFTGSLICSASAGALASFITSPLDLAKLRMQIDRLHQRHSQGLQSNNSAAAQAPLQGMAQTLRRVYAVEGVTGLFRGAGSRVLFHTPSTALTMALFETCRNIWLPLV